jgi:pyruvate dehydrogenase complex dehydrogenase (E1) component
MTQKYGVAVDVWSATSYKELRLDTEAIEELGVDSERVNPRRS